MKAVHSREYYQKNWDRFIQRVPGEHYINLEAELEREMRCYKEAGLPESALATIEALEANKIAERADKLVRKEMATIKSVESGESGFGYTTERQEIEARAEFRTRFEFNCYQLSVFREKHGIQKSNRRAQQ